MSYILEMEIDCLPKTVNAISKKSFWARKNENKKWIQNIFVHSFGRTPIEPLTKCEITITRVSSKEPDTDNLYSSVKSIMDALKTNNIILDDKPSVVTLKCEWEKGLPKKGITRIKIKEVKNDK